VTGPTFRTVRLFLSPTVYNYIISDKISLRFRNVGPGRRVRRRLFVLDTSTSHRHAAMPGRFGRTVSRDRVAAHPPRTARRGRAAIPFHRQSRPQGRHARRLAPCRPLATAPAGRQGCPMPPFLNDSSGPFDPPAPSRAAGAVPVSSVFPPSKSTFPFPKGSLMTKYRLPEHVSAGELADLVGVDPRMIRFYAARDVAVRTDRGQYDLRQSIRNLISEARRTGEPNENRKAEARLKEARAREVELRIAERNRELIPMDDAMEVVDGLMGLIRDELSMLPARLTRNLDDRAKIEAEIDQMLGRFADRAQLEADRCGSGGGAHR